MKLKLTLPILAILLFASCSGNKKAEHAYNETFANLYFLVSGMVERTYEDFSNGKYLTIYDLRQEDPQELFSSIKNEPLKILKGLIASQIEDFRMLKPSSAAEKVHQKANEYFSLVENDLASAFASYADIDCDCPEQKDSIATAIHRLYDKMSTIETDMRQVQLEYMKEVGFEPIQRQ